MCLCVCMSSNGWLIKRGWEVRNICVLLWFLFLLFEMRKWNVYTAPGFGKCWDCQFLSPEQRVSVLLQPCTMCVWFPPSVCTHCTRPTTCESTHVCTLIHVCIHAVSSKCYPPLWCGNVWHSCNPAAGHLIKLWCHLSARLCQPVG